MTVSRFKPVAHHGLLRRQWVLDDLLRVPGGPLLSELKMLELVGQTMIGSPSMLTPYFNFAIQNEHAQIPDTELLQPSRCDVLGFNQYQLAATMWVLSTLSS